MNDSKPATNLTAEELKSVAGGECTAQDYLDALAQLKQAYEDLVDFTSYVIERVAS